MRRAVGQHAFRKGRGRREEEMKDMSGFNFPITEEEKARQVCWS